MKGEIDLALTPRAMEQIQSFMAQVPDDQVLALIQAGVPGSPTAEWTIGTYASAKIEKAEPEYESTGRTLRYEVEGFEIIIESHFAAMLCGKVLDFSNGSFRVSDRKHGI